MGLRKLDESYSRKVQCLEEHISTLQESPHLEEEQPTNASVATLRHRLEELHALHLELEQQNRDLQAAQAALAQDRRHYQELFYQAPEGYLVTDANGTIQQANLAISRQLGLPPDLLVGKPVLGFIATGDRRDFSSHFHSLAQRQQTGDFQTTFQRRGAGVYPARVTTNPVRDPQGRVTGLRWLVRDITHQERLEEEVLRFQGQIIRNLSEGVVVVRDSDHTIVYTNSRFEEMFGYGPTELIGQHVALVNAGGEHSPEEFANYVLLELRKEGSWSGEVHNKRKDGTTFWCHASVSAFEHHDYGNLWIAVQTDITQRKAAQQEVAGYRDQFRLQSDGIKDFAIFLLDPSGRVTTWNRGAQEIKGYDADEIIGQHFSWFYPEEDIRRGKPQHHLDVAAAQGSVEDEGWRLRQGGERFWASVLITPIRGWGGEIEGFAKVVRDLTERKRTEEALSFQGQIIRNLAEGVVVIRDSDGTIVYTNSRFENMYGYGPAELIGKPFMSLNAREDRSPEEVAGEILSGLRRDGSWSGEVHHVRKDGTTCWCYVSASAFEHHEYGNLWICVSTDITGRKAAEEALRESETKFRSLVESANAAIITADEEGRIVSWNQGAMHIFGYTEEEALGQSLTFIMPERYYEIHKESLERASATSEGSLLRKTLELQALRKDGSEVPIDLSLFSWRTGGRRFFSGIIHDVTERKQAEENQVRLRELALQEEEWRRFQTLIDTSPVGVIVVDAGTQRLVLVNQEAQRLRGKSYQVGKHWDECGQDIIHRRPDGREWDTADLPTWRALLYGETVRAEEMIVEFPDGHTMPCLVNASPVYSAEGQIVSAVCVIQDLMPRRELEELRNEFLGMVTHELRTPLSTIKGAAATGLRSRVASRADEGQELFRVIENQVDHVTDLVNDLLDMSRIEAGVFSVVMEPMDLASLLPEATASFSQAFPNHRVNLQLPPDLPEVQADRWRLIQVLSNLLNNAARFSPPNCPITLEVEHQGNFVTVHVRDRGPGIPQEKLPYMFKKFTRLEEGHFGGDSGLGLGLAICQGIVEAHGEHIWADSSTDGTGTTISFTLPVVMKAAGSSPQDFSSTTDKIPVDGAPARRLKVLTVDDDQNALKFLHRLLEGAGYQTIRASGTEEALKAVEMKTPDLVLLDMVLPNAHGLDLMRQIREYYEVPVIFLTARDTRDDMVNALKMGADDYITKPFSESELLARMEAVLRRNLPSRNIERIPPYNFDGLAIDFDQRRVTQEGKEVSLSATEFKLLSELAKHSGRVLTHEQILQLVWGRDYSGETELLRSTVRRLRHKLGENAQNPRYVITVSQVGYRMAVPSALQPVSP